MSFCDQCRIEGGFKRRVGGVCGGGVPTRIMYPPKYRVSLAGSKANLCIAHAKLLRKLAKKRAIDFQYERINE